MRNGNAAQVVCVLLLQSWVQSPYLTHSAGAGYVVLDPYDSINNVAHGAKGPWLVCALLQGEGVADVDGTDNGTVWEQALVRHPRQLCKQRKL